jgi:hypothetical protein
LYHTLGGLITRPTTLRSTRRTTDRTMAERAGRTARTTAGLVAAGGKRAAAAKRCVDGCQPRMSVHAILLLEDDLRGWSVRFFFC